MLNCALVFETELVSHLPNGDYEVYFDRSSRASW